MEEILKQVQDDVSETRIQDEVIQDEVSETSSG